MVFLINGTGYVYYTIGSERVYHKTLINSRVFTEVYTNEDEGGGGGGGRTVNSLNCETLRFCDLYLHVSVVVGLQIGCIYRNNNM